MKAISIREPGVVELVERDIPAVGPGEALLRVRTVGYCGTDLNIFRGLNPLVSYPRVPGHEIGATMEKIGPGSEGGWEVGQQVLVIPYNNCGECSACRAGRVNCCKQNRTLGVQQDGALAEYAVAPVAKLLRSEKLSLAELALVEPLSVGFHAAARGRVTADDTVAVWGAGAIGLGAIAGAAHRGARVIAIDLDDRKLALAKKCGAAIGINAGAENLSDRLTELTAGHGPTVAIEAIGLPDTFRAAVDEVAYAGRVVYIGYAKAPVEYDTKWFILKELDLLGSRNALPEDFAAVVTMLEGGQFPTADVITRTAPLAEACDLLRDWNERPGEITKVQVEL